MKANKSSYSLYLLALAYLCAGLLFSFDAHARKITRVGLTMLQKQHVVIALTDTERNGSNIWVRVGNYPWKQRQGSMAQIAMDGNKIIAVNNNGQLLRLNNVTLKNLKNDAWLQDESQWESINTKDKNIILAEINSTTRSIIFSSKDGPNTQAGTLWEQDRKGRLRHIPTPGPITRLDISGISKRYGISLLCAMNTEGDVFIKRKGKKKPWFFVAKPKGVQFKHIDVSLMTHGTFVFMGIGDDNKLHWARIKSTDLTRLKRSRKTMTLELEWKELERARAVDFDTLRGAQIIVNPDNHLYTRTGLNVFNFGTEKFATSTWWTKVPDIPKD